MSFSLMAHVERGDRIECRANPENAGALTLDFGRDDVTVFVQDAALSAALRDAINNVLNVYYMAKKHDLSQDDSANLEAAE